MRIGTAAATASMLSDERPRHMLAAVATAVRCTLVWKKSRKDSTASRPPCLSTDCADTMAYPSMRLGLIS